MTAGLLPSAGAASQVDPPPTYDTACQTFVSLLVSQATQTPCLPAYSLVTDTCDLVYTQVVATYVCSPALQDSASPTVVPDFFSPVFPSGLLFFCGHCLFYCSCSFCLLPVLMLLYRRCFSPLPLHIITTLPVVVLLSCKRHPWPPGPSLPHLFLFAYVSPAFCAAIPLLL